MTVAVYEPAQVETAQERAVRRVEELKHAVGSVLEILAAIYRDQDWRYLRDDSGASYSGFTEFVQHTLGGSASNARRYRQGVETLVAPLQELTAAGTRIPVTPNDVVRLGQSGAKAVVMAAPEALSGVTDSSAQTTVLRELIDEVITEHHSPTGGEERGGSEAALLPPIPAAVPVAALPSAGAEPDATFGDDDDQAAAAESAPDGGAVGSAPAGMAAGDVDQSGAAADIGVVERQLAQPSAAQRKDVEECPSLSGGCVGEALTCDELQAALATVLRVDPVAVTDVVDVAHSAQTARDCLVAAQRLARLGQLLKALS